MTQVLLYSAEAREYKNPITIFGYNFSDFDEILFIGGATTSDSWGGKNDVYLRVPASKFTRNEYTQFVSMRDAHWITYRLSEDNPDSQLVLIQGNNAYIRRIYGIKYHGKVTPRPVDPVVYYQNAGTAYEYEHILKSLEYCKTEQQTNALYNAIKTALPDMLVQRSGNLYPYSYRWVTKQTADPAFMWWQNDNGWWYRAGAVSDVSYEAAEVSLSNASHSDIRRAEFEYMGKTWYGCLPGGYSIPDAISTTNIYLNEEYSVEGLVRSAHKIIDLYVPMFGYPSDYLET